MSEKTIRVRNMQETVRRQLVDAPVNVNLSGSTARSSQLTGGDYYVKATVACFIRQGTVAVDAATTDYPLDANEEIVVHVDDATTRGYIAGITSGGTGVLRIKAVEAI